MGRGGAEGEREERRGEERRGAPSHVYHLSLILQ